MAECQGMKTGRERERQTIKKKERMVEMRKVRKIDNTIKRGYTAVVIPGTSHNYFLVLSTNLF